MPPARTRLPKTIVRLGWVSFLTDIASEMTYPVLTLFLVGTLGAPAAFLGFVEGFSEALVSLMKAWSGWHSDRRGSRLPYVQVGYALSALSRPLLGLANGWLLVWCARSMDRFGKGLRTAARDALLAQAAPPGEKGRAFGFHRSMDTAGAVLGIAATTAFLVGHSGQYREIFFFSTLPGALAVLTTFLVPERTRPGRTAHCSHNFRESLAQLPASYWRALAVITVFAVANSSDTFLLLRARQLGASDGETVGLYGLFYLSYALLSYPAGVLSDRMGRWHTLGAGWTLYALVYAGFAVAGEVHLVALFMLYGVYMGLSEGVSRAAVSDQAPRHLQGTAQGVLGLVLGVTTMTSSLLAGLLWDWMGPQAPFVLGSAMAALAVILLIFFMPSCPVPEDEG